VDNVFGSPFFGITLSVLAFEIGVVIERKTGVSAANPLLIAILICIGFLKLTGVPLRDFNAGGDVITVFLGPATAVLAISIYTQIGRLKKYFIPIVAGALAGSVVSVCSVLFFCRAFGLSEVLTKSLLVKSVSTPFAIAISRNIGGIPSVSVSAVVLTGILGAVTAPFLIRIFRVRDSVAAGVAIGTCSHAVGTSKAVTLGEVEGAMSGIALGLSGIITVILTLVFRF
jgi:putative effector of murein hydrolase